MNIVGKRILVTGASEGIGAEIAIKLATDGAKVVLVARLESNLNKVKNAIEKLGGQVEIYTCNARKGVEIKNVCAKILAAGDVDVLINNAGVWHKRAPLMDISDSVIDDVIATNLTGAIKFTKQLLPGLIGRKEAAIINVISKSGIVAQDGQSVYSATKYGMRGFTDVLRADLKDTSVKVGAVYQSGVDTEFFRKTDEIFDQSRLMDPEDLADAICYMLKVPPKIWISEIRVNI
jgi:short-subunit dehydrogenase